jgi:hypothetical protein
VLEKVWSLERFHLARAKREQFSNFVFPSRARGPMDSLRSVILVPYYASSQVVGRRRNDYWLDITAVGSPR